MKRPVWNYRLEATTNAPIEVVQAKLRSLASARPLSVCGPRWADGAAKGWTQTASSEPEASSAAIRLGWSARSAGLVEEAWFSAQATEAGCALRAEGKVKGWPLLWRLPLLEWRSQGLIQRFVASL